MGNHLAATASVNVSDISSELELISPLNGNGQNCFVTFHCWRHVRYEEQQDKAQRQTFQSISPHVLQMYTQICLEDEQNVSSSNNMNAVIQSDDECTNYGQNTVENTFADKKKTYIQQLLSSRRKTQEHRLLEINKCTQPVLFNDLCVCRNQEETNKCIDSPITLEHSVHRGKELPSAQSSSLFEESMETLEEQSQKHWKKKNEWISRDEIICRLFLLSQTRRVGVVTKIFVYAANNNVSSLKRVKHLHAILKAMQTQMEQVNNANFSSISCDTSNHNGNTDKVNAIPRHNLFYSMMDSTDSRFALLERSYVAFSLTERLATRPYWTRHERCFMCFQLLHAVAQLHEVCHTVHGDIKANNVLVQSNGWLYLTDAAPFKPAIMPIDNPALFDYFYNTDEAHICCCAPEKFAPLSSSSLLFEEYVKHTCELQEEEHYEEKEEEHHDHNEQDHEKKGEKDKSSSQDNSINKESVNRETSAVKINTIMAAKCHESNDNINYYYHSCAMDVFSTGCVMAYILTGRQLLRLSDVLELRDAAHSHERVERIRSTLTEHHLTSGEIDLLMEMLNPLPQHRPSASALLSRYTNFVFPAYFGVLHTNIMSQLLLCSSADEQLLLLHSSLTSMIKTCVASTCHSHEKSNAKVVNTSVVADNVAETEEKTYAVTKTRADDADHLQKNAIMSYDNYTIKDKCISHVLQLLLPFLFHALRHARSAEAVYRGLLCLQSWHTKCKLSTQINVILPELFYVINARKQYDVHSRVVALRVVCTIALTICKNVERILWQDRECQGTNKKNNNKFCDEENKCETSNNNRHEQIPSFCSHNCGSGVVNSKTNFSTTHAELNDRNGDDEEDEEYQADIKVVRESLLLFDHFYIPCVAELIDNIASELSEVMLVELATQLPRLLLLARYCVAQSQNMYQMKYRREDNCTSDYTSMHHLEQHNINSDYNNENDNKYRLAANFTNSKLFDVRLDCLVSAGWDMLHVLYRHPCDEVCIALLQRSLQIASFLGNERTSQDLLPLYTTLIVRSTRVQEVLYFQAITLHLYLMHNNFTTMRFFVEEGLRQNNIACQCATLRALNTVIRTDTHQPYHLFIVEDMMLLIHSILPFLLSANDLLRIAACRVIQTAVQCYSETVVKEYLEWAIRPFLIRPVPLEQLVYVSREALRPELRYVMNRNDETTFDENNSIYNDLLVERQHYLEKLSGCINRTQYLSLLQEEQESKKRAIIHWQENDTNTSRIASNNDRIDIQQTRCSNNEEQETNEPEWKWRQRARALLTENVLNSNSSSNSGKTNILQSEQIAIQGEKRDNSRLQEQHRSCNLSSRAHHVQQHHLCPPNTYESVSCAFQPSATPLHIRAAHMGAIYKLCIVSPSFILSVGACHEGLMWQLKSHELHNMLHLRLPEEYYDDNNNNGRWRGSSKNAFTCAQTLSKCHSESGNTTYNGNTSTMVALGSTSGFIYLWDAVRNEYVNKICVDDNYLQWNAHDENGTDGAHGIANKTKLNVNVSVTSLALQSPQVLLCTTSSGQLHAIDTRIKFNNHYNDNHHHQWTSTLSTSVGVPSCCLPLYYNGYDNVSNSYGVVVGTTAGVACLYDLRFQRCVQEYHLPSFEENAMWTWQNGCAMGLDTNSCAHDGIYTSASHDATASALNLQSRFARPAITASVLENYSCPHSTPLCEGEEVNSGPVCLLAASDGVVYRLHLQSGSMTRKLVTRQSCFYYNKHSMYRELNTQLQEHSHRTAVHSMISVSYANEQRLLTAGADKYIRSWSLSQPSHSHYLYRPPYSSPAFNSKTLTDLSNTHLSNNFENASKQTDVNNNHAISARENVLQTIYEIDAPRRYAINTVNHTTDLSSYTQSSLSLQMPTHHADEIMTLAIAQDTDSSEPLLLSAARDGSLVIWANQGL